MNTRAYLPLSSFLFTFYFLLFILQLLLYFHFFLQLHHFLKDKITQLTSEHITAHHSVSILHHIMLNEEQQNIAKVDFTNPFITDFEC